MHSWTYTLLGILLLSATLSPAFGQWKWIPGKLKHVTASVNYVYGESTVLTKSTSVCNLATAFGPIFQDFLSKLMQVMRRSGGWVQTIISTSAQLMEVVAAGNWYPDDWNMSQHPEMVTSGVSTWMTTSTSAKSHAQDLDICPRTTQTDWCWLWLCVWCKLCQ